MKKARYSPRLMNGRLAVVDALCEEAQARLRKLRRKRPRRTRGVLSDAEVSRRVARGELVPLPPREVKA